MSQYPYGYGQQQGAPSTMPYGFQAPPHPAQQAYINAQDQHASTSVNRNISHSAFDYNANNIPGLGIASSPPAATSYVPLWVSSGAQAPAQPSRPLGTSASNATLLGGSYGSSRAQVAAAPSQPPALQTQTTYDDVEEGELSEGQFEDLYEPLIAEPQPTSKPGPKPSSAASLSGSNSAVDTPEAGFYGNDDDDGGALAPAKNASAGGMLDPHTEFRSIKLMLACSTGTIWVVFSLPLSPRNPNRKHNTTGSSGQWDKAPSVPIRRLDPACKTPYCWKQSGTSLSERTCGPERGCPRATHHPFTRVQGSSQWKQHQSQTSCASRAEAQLWTVCICPRSQEGGAKGHFGTAADGCQVSDLSGRGL